MKCPVCRRDEDITVEVSKRRVNGKMEDFSHCPCHLQVPLRQSKVESKGEDGKKIVEAVLEIPPEAIEEDFVRVGAHKELVRPGFSPVVFRYLGSNGAMPNFIVLYENAFADGILNCPRCGVYQGKIEIISGSHTARACQQNLRKKYDGRNGKCGAITKYIWRNNQAGPGILQSNRRTP